MSKAPIDIRSLARSYTDMAIQTLAGVAQNGLNEGARVRAAECLLERGWGKAAQPIENSENGAFVISWQNKGS